MTLLLIKRNFSIFFREIKGRFLCLYLADLLILLVHLLHENNLDVILYGVWQDGNFFFPFEWFMFVIVPILALGPAFKKLILIDYPLVSEIRLLPYELASLLPVLALSAMFLLTWFLLGQGWLIGMQYIYIALTELLLILLYSAISVFINDASALLIMIVILLIAISFNQMPFVSALMLVRMPKIDLFQYWLEALMVMIFIVFLFNKVSDLDFVV